MKESRYELIIFWDESDQIFVVDVPELPGCMAHGRTKSEAIGQAEAAIDLWIETAKEDGIAITRAARQINLCLEEGIFLWR